MANDIKTVGVQLIVEPAGIELDRDGRIRFSDPRILQALVAAVPSDLLAAEEATNYFQCGPVNNYQCGKAAVSRPGSTK